MYSDNKNERIWNPAGGGKLVREHILQRRIRAKKTKKKGNDNASSQQNKTAVINKLLAQKILMQNKTVRKWQDWLKKMIHKGKKKTTRDWVGGIGHGKRKHKGSVNGDPWTPSFTLIGNVNLVIAVKKYECTKQAFLVERGNSNQCAYQVVDGCLLWLAGEWYWYSPTLSLSARWDTHNLVTCQHIACWCVSIWMANALPCSRK